VSTRSAYASAQAAISARVSAAIEDIRQCNNVDGRLIARFKSLSLTLSRDIKEFNPVEFAFITFEAGSIVDASQEELSSALHASLSQVVVACQMFANNFIEWRDFSEKSSELEVSEKIVADTIEAARSIKESMERESDFIDPEVPQLIGSLLGLRRNPKVTLKRLFFSIVRSIENVIGQSLQYLNNIGKDIFDEIRKDFPQKAAKTLSTVLCMLAVAGVVQLGAIVGVVPSSAWLGRAAEIVKQATNFTK